MGLKEANQNKYEEKALEELTLHRDSKICSHCANKPPSTPMTLFVTYPVLTIQTTVSATSSGVPSTPIGISAHSTSAIHPPTNAQLPTDHVHLLFANSSGFPGSIFVSLINAGATPLTVMPFGP